MNKLKTSLLIPMLLASISAFVGYAPDSVQIALKEMYPTAAGMAWSQDKAYYVADSVMNGSNTRAWFTPDARWVTKQVDWKMLDEVPAVVSNTFAASEFSDGVVQNVTWVQSPEWQPIAAIQVGEPNMQMEYQILFTPRGEVPRQQSITNAYNTLGISTFL